MSSKSYGRTGIAERVVGGGPRNRWTEACDMEPSMTFLSEIVQIRRAMSVLCSDLSPDVPRQSAWTLSTGAAYDLSVDIPVGLPVLGLDVGDGFVSFATMNNKTGDRRMVLGVGAGIGVSLGPDQPISESYSTGQEIFDPPSCIPHSSASRVFLLAAGNDTMTSDRLFGGWAISEDLAGGAGFVGYSASLIWFSDYPMMPGDSVWEHRLYHVKACTIVYGPQWTSSLGIGADIRIYRTRVLTSVGV